MVSKIMKCPIITVRVEISCITPSSLCKSYDTNQTARTDEWTTSSQKGAVCLDWILKASSWFLALLPPVMSQGSSCEDKKVCRVGSNVQYVGFTKRIFIHPLSITTYPLYAGLWRELEPITASTGHKAGYALHKSPVYHRAFQFGYML